MATLETELRLKVFEIPHGRPVPGLRSVVLRVPKRLMYLCVEQFRLKAGLMMENRHSHREMSDMLVCQDRPVWLDEQDKEVDVPWFAKGMQPVFVSKNGTLHLMNMHRKKLVRSDGYSLATLMEDFGEDPEPATLPQDRLLPGQLQGRLALPARF